MEADIVVKSSALWKYAAAKKFGTPYMNLHDFLNGKHTKAKAGKIMAKLRKRNHEVF